MSRMEWMAGYMGTFLIPLLNRNRNHNRNRIWSARRRWPNTTAEIAETRSTQRIRTQMAQMCADSILLHCGGYWEADCAVLPLAAVKPQWRKRCKKGYGPDRNLEDGYAIFTRAGTVGES